MKKSVIFIVALLFTAIVAIGFCSQTNIANADWQEYELKDTYRFNEVLDVPQITVNVGGNSYKANSSVEFPDGTATNAQSITLNQTGKYILHINAKVDGKVYSTEREFFVVGNYYNYGSNSIVEYGKTNAKFVEAGVHTYEYTAPSNNEYLFVSLAQGDTLTFSSYVDVHDLSYTDSQPFISAFVLPSVVGVYDFDHLLFTLADSEDPSITLTFLANRVTSNADWAKMTTYVMAYGNGQAPTGAEYSGEQIAKLHVSDGWGTAFNHSFIKLDSSGNEFDPSTQCIQFWYEAADVAVYTKSYGAAMREVADMDDTAFFGGAWTGFPSGKARLSVTATDFNGNRKANFCIKSIKGLDLSQELFVDENAPKITVNTEYNLQQMPEGKLDHVYPVPTATAKDDYDGVRTVNTSVYYDYSSQYPLNINVRDGAFVPTQTGTYTIVYSATDTNGNVGKVAVNVHVGRAIEPLCVTVPESKTTQTELGCEIEIPAPTVQGGSGNVKVITQVTCGSDVYGIENGIFRPERIGTLTVTYTATDYLGDSATASYQIETSNGTKSVFVDEIVFPKALVAGQKYVTPSYYLNDYSSGSLNRKLAKVRITDADGAKVYQAGETFTVSVAGDEGKVTVEFFDETVSKSFQVPAFVAYTQLSATSASRVFFDRYFITDDFAKTCGASGIEFVKVGGSGDATFTFANQLIARTFKLDLKKFVGSFDALEVVLQDVTNPSNCIKATLQCQGKNAILCVGNNSAEIANVFTESGFSLRFNANNEFVLGKATLGNKDFAGFANDKVYVTVTFKQMKQNATFTVGRLCSHTFSSAKSDTFEPEIVTLGNYGGSYEQGSVYTICPVISADVFCVNVNFTLTVRTPSGEVATDINGTRLENVDPTQSYKLKLDQYGSYSFSYSSTETDNGPSTYAQSSMFYYIANVCDNTAPTISVKEMRDKPYKVGESIAIPDITVTDDKSPADKITVLVAVVDCNGTLTFVNSDAVKFGTAGTYELRIMAIDEAGNISLQRIQLQIVNKK